MASPITVDYGPLLAVCDGFQCCIQHGVGETRVRFGPDGPTDNHAVEAIDDRREIDFARAYVELGDIGQPFLIWRESVKVTVDDVLRCWAEITAAG